MSDKKAKGFGKKADRKKVNISRLKTVCEIFWRQMTLEDKGDLFEEFVEKAKDTYEYCINNKKYYKEYIEQPENIPLNRDLEEYLGDNKLGNWMSLSVAMDVLGQLSDAQHFLEQQSTPQKVKDAYSKQLLSKKVNFKYPF